MEAKNDLLPIDITADTNFIQEVIEMMTISGRLPFTVPPNHIPLRIKWAAKYFYKKHTLASEIKRYVVRLSDLQNNGHSLTYELPDYIIGVHDIQQSNGGASSVAYNRSPNLIMMNAMKFNDFANGTFNMGGISGQDGMYMYQQGYGQSDALLALFESSVMESSFQDGIQYDYNQNTNRFTLLGKANYDLVLEVSEGIELRYLYQDELFLKYVTGQCLKDLKSVLGTFGFNMPGAIEVNYSEYAEMGQELIDEVKQELEDDDGGGDMFFIV